MNVCARSDSEYDCVLILSETFRTYSMIVCVPMIMSPPKEALRFHIFQVPGRQSDPHIQRRHVLRPLGYWNWSTGTDHHKRRTSFHDQWYLQYFFEYWNWPTSLYNIHSWSAPEQSHKECKGNFDLLAEDHNCSVIIAVALWSPSLPVWTPSSPSTPPSSQSWLPRHQVTTFAGHTGDVMSLSLSPDQVRPLTNNIQI